MPPHEPPNIAFTASENAWTLSVPKSRRSWSQERRQEDCLHVPRNTTCSPARDPFSAPEPRRRQVHVIERQINALRTWAIDCNHHVVAEVEDRSVSGNLAPLSRPKLGKWFTPDHLEMWDALAVSTQDRMSRNDLQFMGFIQHVMDWGKSIVILDDPSFDILSQKAG
ncbi:recombinase family protein [Streptomyces sp. ISL-96]|uniref:recombinase family protein n=1 Tax=Streptomyces sp. ISL-96 TaxID=2819191 RepID=UPI001BEC7E30|nr:recombinase family protein [Streptomyces sp. ISL-96]MBT2487334.1 recombinase family protein [Streptomyces sp. ISL-96]